MHLINGYCFIAFSYAVFIGLANMGSVGSDVVPVGPLSKQSLRPVVSTAKRKQSWKKIQLVLSALYAGSSAEYSPSLVANKYISIKPFGCEYEFVDIVSG